MSAEQQQVPRRERRAAEREQKRVDRKIEVYERFIESSRAIVRAKFGPRAESASLQWIEEVAKWHKSGRICFESHETIGLRRAHGRRWSMAHAKRCVELGIVRKTQRFMRCRARGTGAHPKNCRCNRSPANLARRSNELEIDLDRAVKLLRELGLADGAPAGVEELSAAASLAAQDEPLVDELEPLDQLDDEHASAPTTRVIDPEFERLASVMRENPILEVISSDREIATLLDLGRRVRKPIDQIVKDLLDVATITRPGRASSKMNGDAIWNAAARFVRATRASKDGSSSSAPATSSPVEIPKRPPRMAREAQVAAAREALASQPMSVSEAAGRAAQRARPPP